MTDNNLGALYADQGRFSDAKKMHLRALAGFEKALGAEHASSLTVVRIVGNLYTLQGRSTEAEKMFHRPRLEKIMHLRRSRVLYNGRMMSRNFHGE